MMVAFSRKILETYGFFFFGDFLGKILKLIWIQVKVGFVLGFCSMIYVIFESSDSVEDPMVIDADESKAKRPKTTNSDQNQSAKKFLKRKRVAVVDSLTTEERETRINALREELEGLFKYYKEVLDEKVNLNLGDCGSSNSVIACVLEESNLSLSKLVGEIYEKTKETESGITIASLKSFVLLIGQRSLYGVPNADAEDER